MSDLAVIFTLIFSAINIGIYAVWTVVKRLKTRRKKQLEQAVVYCDIDSRMLYIQNHDPTVPNVAVAPNTTRQSIGYPPYEGHKHVFKLTHSTGNYYHFECTERVGYLNCSWIQMIHKSKFWGKLGMAETIAFNKNYELYKKAMRDMKDFL